VLRWEELVLSYYPLWKTHLQGFFQHPGSALGALWVPR
jgi:hypothetical protein